MVEEAWVPDADWATIVARVPIVSVDLVVVDDSGVLLGKRRYEPAKGEWFIPGGRVRKGERLREAVHRVAAEELGVEVTIEGRLGAYEHFYDTSDVEGVGSKHYVACAFVVRVSSGTPSPDDQHEAIRVFEHVPEDLHEYPAAYLRDAKAAGHLPFLD